MLQREREVSAGRVSSETRSAELKGNAACRRVCVSAALCYTESLVSQQNTAGGGGGGEKSKHETLNTIRTGGRKQKLDAVSLSSLFLLLLAGEVMFFFHVVFSSLKLRVCSW